MIVTLCEFWIEELFKGNHTFVFSGTCFKYNISIIEFEYIIRPKKQDRIDESKIDEGKMIYLSLT
jgi:hypothetical protein